MNNRNRLQDIACQVSDLLQEYVAIHNKLLKEGGTLKSLIGNIFLSKGINFKALYEDANNILAKFRSKQEDIVSLKSDCYESLLETEKEFFNCLSEYTNALTNTVKILCDRANLLYQRSENKKARSFKEFKQIGGEYQKSIDEYLKIGQRLTVLYNKIQR